LLVAFPDDDSIEAHASAAGFEVNGSIEMSSHDLLESWQASQYGPTPIAGLVVHTADTAAEAEQPTPFTERILPTMLGLSYSVRVEAAVRVVAMWREAGAVPAQAPTGELALLARHPFGVLHKKEGQILTRLCDGRDGGPLLFAAADTVMCEHLQLNEQTPNYDVQHCTMAMVVRALQKAGSTEGLRLIYGWDESITELGDGPNSNIWAGGKKLCFDWHSPEEMVEVFRHSAGIDLLAEGGTRGGTET